MEMTFTIVPGAPRRSMSFTTACIVKKGPRRLTAMWASNSSGVVSTSVPRVVSPAELTRQSTRPNSATALATAACAWATSLTSACTNKCRDALLGELGHELLAGLRAATGDDDPRHLRAPRPWRSRPRGLGYRR